MSDDFDTVIVGGGVIGLSVAFGLAQSGQRVCALDKGLCGREASWAGAGIISPPNIQRGDALAAMHWASMDQYPDFCAAVTQVSGIDTEYTPCGELSLLTTDQFVRMAQSDVKAMQDRQTEGGQAILELLAPEQGREIEPELTGACLAVLHSRATAQVRNPRLLRALGVACEKQGVAIREHCPVAGLLRHGDRVTGVRTADYEIRAQQVVLCAGAWSGDCLGDSHLAEMIPCHPVRGQILLLHTDRPIVSRVITRRQAYLVPRDDGHLLVGATHEPESGFDKRNTPQGINWLIQEALAMVPSLANMPVVCSWAGLRPGTPDHRPFIGPVPGYPGLIAATGHYRSGLTLAPVTAEIVRELIVSDSTPFDLALCAPGRTMQTRLP